MKKIFAIPTVDKKLCQHFGHCQQFSIVTVEDKEITEEQYVTPPPHEPGLLPKWLHEQNVNVIIAGGMGMRAQQLFAQNNIEVYCGVAFEEPKILVQHYLTNTLKTGENLCDH